MKEYEIRLETIKHPKLGDIDKLFIHYFGGKFDGLKEYYGRPDKEAEHEIREGYTKHIDSL